MENSKVQAGLGHKAKKSMGQNFLKSQPALNMMCEAGSVDSTDTVLEIGPGKGALTEKLLHKAGRVIAIEKDRDLIEYLNDKFVEEIKNGKLDLREGDILNFDPSSLGIKDGGYKIIANIPYNITGAIIKRFLSETIPPNTMILLVQKEVAERIVARVHVRHGHGKESILSLSVKAYGHPSYVMKVGKRFFSPSPKVDSAIIAIDSISKNNFKTKKEEQEYFNIIKAAFAHKRKVVKKNLESIYTKEQIEKMFTSLNIPDKSRAEDLALPIWLALAKGISHI